MDRKIRNILIAITSVILVMAVLFGWSFWRKKVTAEEQQEAQSALVKQQQKEQKQQSQSEAQKNTQTNTEYKLSDADKQMVIQAEHAMRDWGSDALKNPADWAKQDASTVLTQLRGDIDEKHNPLTQYVSFQLDDKTGPNGVNPVCPDGNNKGIYLCEQAPNAARWWHMQAWAYGSRWVSEPTVTQLSNNQVEVAGTVKAILLTRGDTMSNGTYSAITPAWTEYAVNDVITVKDGKITKIQHMKVDPWWINPWLHEWDRRMVENMGDNVNTQRIAIPVKGTLTYDGLHNDGETRVLKTPVTMGDLDGKVDWSLWDGITMTQTKEQGDKMMEECKAKYGDDCPLL